MPIDRSKPSTDVSAIGPTFAARSRVVHDTIKPAKSFDGEFHERFCFGSTCRVCPVKRYVFAEFRLERFPFLVQEIAKDNPSPFVHETPDNSCSYSSGAACNDGHLIFQFEPR